MSTFMYFAYGSNMLTERLRARCAGARPVGTGMVPDRTVRFQKRGTDDSGKAILAQASDLWTHGVLFEVPEEERGALDHAEGDGYQSVTDLRVRVASEVGGMRWLRGITTYLVQPDWHTTRLRPYDWYLSLVVSGATQHGLPEDYIARLRSELAIPDPIPSRPGRLDAVAALRAAGYSPNLGDRA